MIRAFIRESLQRRSILIVAGVGLVVAAVAPWHTYVEVREAQKAASLRALEARDALENGFVCSSGICTRAEPNDPDAIIPKDPSDNPIYRDRIEARRRAETRLEALGSHLGRDLLGRNARIAGAGLGIAVALLMASVLLASDWSMGLWRSFALQRRERWPIQTARIAATTVLTSGWVLAAIAVALIASFAYGKRVGVPTTLSFDRGILWAILAVATTATYVALASAVAVISKNQLAPVVILALSVPLEILAADKWAALRAILPGQLTGSIVVTGSERNPGWPEPIMFEKIGGAAFGQLPPIETSVAVLGLMAWALLGVGVALVTASRRDL